MGKFNTQDSGQITLKFPGSQVGPVEVLLFQRNYSNLYPESIAVRANTSGPNLDQLGTSIMSRVGKLITSWLFGAPVVGPCPVMRECSFFGSSNTEEFGAFPFLEQTTGPA